MPIIQSSDVDALIVSDLGALKLARDENIDCSYEYSGQYIQL